MQLRRVEIVLRQPGLGARHGQPGGGVGVHHAVGLGQVLVDRAVHGEPRRIHDPGAVVEFVALQVDLEQVARRDFAVVQAEGVDQELLVSLRHAVRQPQRDVVVDHLGPAKHREDAVAGREFEPRGPLVRMDCRLAGRLENGIHGGTLRGAGLPISSRR
jgi:hypothetical protein